MSNTHRCMMCRVSYSVRLDIYFINYYEWQLMLSVWTLNELDAMQRTSILWPLHNQVVLAGWLVGVLRPFSAQRRLYQRQHVLAFSALTLLVGQQEVHPSCKKWVVRYWHGYLSGSRCKWFAYGPADATATRHLAAGATSYDILLP